MGILDLGMVKGTNGQGIPTGGSAGQILEKIDGSDFNIRWKTLQAILLGAQTLSVDEKAIQRTKFGIGEILWEGTLSEGGVISDASIVAKLNKYSIYAFGYGSARVGICLRVGTGIYGGGAFWDTVHIKILGFNATLTSTAFTLTASRIVQNDAITTIYANNAVWAIIGLA